MRSGLKVTDELLKNLGALRSEGNILPPPIITIQKLSYPDGEVAVVEVKPSLFPPVRYKGKVWIRIGPRKAIANEAEERILIERRQAGITTFDSCPFPGATLNDLDSELFKHHYLPKAIDEEVLNRDTRDLSERMASLRLFDIKVGNPTVAGILLLGKNPEYFLPGAYVQYVRFSGTGREGSILRELKFSDNLITMLNKLDGFIDTSLVERKPVPVSVLREEQVLNYPYWALRELLMNAVMHRDYQSNTPIRLYQFDDRIEIMNAGGLYGNARPENFPNEHCHTSLRHSLFRYGRQTDTNVWEYLTDNLCALRHSSIAPAMPNTDNSALVLPEEQRPAQVFFPPTKCL